MREVLEFLYFVAKLFYHWRWNVCFWGSLILAFVLVPDLPHDWLRWPVGILIIGGGIVMGWIWDNQSE
jgi:hypothetical protein